MQALPQVQLQAPGQPAALVEAVAQVQAQVRAVVHAQAGALAQEAPPVQGLAQAPVLLPPHPEAAGCAAPSPEAFCEAYLRVLLHVVTSGAYEAARAAWLPHVTMDFTCICPTGVAVVCDDPVLTEWRIALNCGHYSALWLSDLCLYRFGAGGVDCRATFVRRYTGRQGQDVARDMLCLQVIATPCQDGFLRVSRHCYQLAPPKEFGGVKAHSQIGQDLWVLHHFKSIRNGFFLEVGANHAEELSNTYLLEKAAGWSGVCVEPFPSGDWSSRSRSELARVALGPDGSRLRFVAPGHVLGGLADQVDLPRVARDVPPEQQGVVEVETRTLASILRLARPGGSPVPRVIHYMSLDTEGSEYDILCGFPWDICTLLSITVEHNFQEPARTRIRQLLESRGFILDVSVEHDDYFLLAGYEKHL